MALVTTRCKNLATFMDGAAATTITVTLPAPGAGLAWLIRTIWLKMVGTVTAFDVQVQDSASTVLAVAGGQVGGATNGSLPAHVPLVGPCCTKANDAPKVILTATGATQVNVTVHAELVNG